MADTNTPDQQTLVITIPGVNDVLAIPPLEDPHVKRERITRWSINAERSTIPEPLRWLPQVINWFDDAQDILITGLVLAKPLLRKLPARFVPYLGWGLLANDVINLFVGMISAPLNPRALKADFYKTTRNAMAGRTARVRAAEAFLLPGRTKWIPFALQAGQVLYTFTGWGLRLGGIMQTISETWWGFLATLQGQRVEIKGPPPHDPAAKAARFLAQSFNWNAISEIANEVEISTLAAAHNMAMSLLGAPHIEPADDLRLQTLAELSCPIFEVWSPSSKLALQEWGAPPLRQQRCATPTADPQPTQGLAARATIAQAPDLDVTLAKIIRSRWIDWPTGLMASEAAKHTWDVFGAGLDVVVPLNSPMERMLGFALETSTLPPFLATPTEPLLRRLVSADHMNETDGLGRPIQATTCQYVEHGWHLPIAYPPPIEDPNAQIAHWCAIALALFCRKRLAFPIYEYSYENSRVFVRDWVYGMGKLPNVMESASILVWGNAWRRTSGPRSFEPHQPNRELRICVPNESGYPSLSGAIPETPEFQMILDALPKPGTPPRAAGFDNRTTPNWQTRTWLDAYLKQEDERRQRGPAWPEPSALPAPLADNPADWLPTTPCT